MANEAKIHANRETINSGFCSGNKNVRPCINQPPSDKCKGTVRSYCAESSTTGPVDIYIPQGGLNSGAFTGPGGRDSGSIDEGNKRGHAGVNNHVLPAGPSRVGKDPVDKDNKRGHAAHGAYKDSEIIGTYQSFNVGIRLGSEPSDDESFLEIPETWKKCNEKDKLPDHNNTYGTRGSFNAIGGSKIDAMGATINSGCGAGNNIEENLLQKIQEKYCTGYKCGGTEKSFNAEGQGKEINIMDAKLNTGAFAGSTTK